MLEIGDLMRIRTVIDSQTHRIEKSHIISAINAVFPTH
jgi:hypothetical protein